MKNNKQRAAFSSVIAAVFLTLIKIIVGILIGSLGILSEALHSGLDLCAAVITLFAVKYSDKPADRDHHYGHGKIESFSALLETVLLFVTCAWIIHEAVQKLFFGKSVEIIGSQWGILTMIIAIGVDLGRVKVLKEVSHEHRSQALEADAIHFSSDIWSSSAVIAGLVCVWVGSYFKIPYLQYADPIAALGVALLVIKVSFKLGKETIDVLLDTAPKGMQDKILNEIKNINGIIDINTIRIRPSGAEYFININIGVDKNKSHNELNTIVHEIRNKIEAVISNSDISVSTFPVDVFENQGDKIYNDVSKIVARFPICTNVHNIKVYEVQGKKKIAAHIELKEDISLKQSHELEHKIQSTIEDELVEIDEASIHFQCFEKIDEAEEITETRKDIIENILESTNKMSESINCHDIRLYTKNNKISTFLHCELKEDYSIDNLDKLSRKITNQLKDNIECIDSVHIHFEPVE